MLDVKQPKILMFDVIEGKILVFSVFEIPPSRPSKKYPNRSHKDKFFCADTYSVGIIFNRNSVKSTAAPFFFFFTDVLRSPDALVLRNGKEM